MMLLDQSEGEIDRGRDAGRRPDPAVSNEYALFDNGDGRKPRLQSVEVGRVSGGTATVEHARRTQHERARADGDQGRYPCMGPSQPRDDSGSSVWQRLGGERTDPPATMAHVGTARGRLD